MYYCSKPDCEQQNPQPADQFRNKRTKKSSKYSCCKSYWAKYRSKFWIDNFERVSAAFLVRKYWPHLTWQQARDEYNRLLTLQKGVCAICEKPETSIHPKTGKPRKLAVDHNHGTSAVRGLLCGVCNKAIGALKDDVELLKKAVAYLEKHELPKPNQEPAKVIPIRKFSSSIAPVNEESKTKPAS